MLRVTGSWSQGSGAVNEDVVGHCEGAAWVIDGATGLGANLIAGPSDAAWIATCADRELRAGFTRDSARSTPDILREVMAACRDAFAAACGRAAAAPHELPSAALALIRQVPDGIECATLGDCRIVYRDTDGAARLFGTTNLTTFEARTIAMAEHFLAEAPDVDPLDLRALLLPQLQENRRMMNVPGGYWVLGTDPAAADHCDVAVVPAVPGDCFALASDGFLRLIELFAVATPADFLAIETLAGFDQRLEQLRTLERAPYSCRSFARVKVSDDASFVHCSVG